ncbi:MAG: DUF4199 domain-containing protein [Woeseia sp.]
MIFTYGIISGLVVIGTAVLALALSGGEETLHAQEWLGYLIMLIALSMIFVGIRRYRDRQLGGVIRFGTAMLLGLGIAAVAGVVYVAVWEIYLAMTDYARTAGGDREHGIDEAPICQTALSSANDVSRDLPGGPLDHFDIGGRPSERQVITCVVLGHRPCKSAMPS